VAVSVIPNMWLARSFNSSKRGGTPLLCANKQATDCGCGRCATTLDGDRVTDGSDTRESIM
jgi:hypothetical protein